MHDLSKSESQRSCINDVLKVKCENKNRFKFDTGKFQLIAISSLQ